MSAPEVKPLPCGGMQRFLSRTFCCHHDNKGGEDQIYLKLQSSLRCVGETCWASRGACFGTEAWEVFTPFVIFVCELCTPSVASVMSVIPGGAGKSLNGSAGPAFLSF